MINLEPQTLMNAICYIEQTLFPSDLEDELRKIGAPAEEITMLVTAFKIPGKCSLVELYKDYAYGPRHDVNQRREYLSRVLENQIANYLKVKGLK